MAPSVQQIYSNGIYHGLPVIDPSKRGLKAIVVGASGMSGQPMIDVLTQDQQRWSEVFAMSRRPPQSQSPNVQHVPLDLSKEPQEIATLLQNHSVQA